MQKYYMKNTNPLYNFYTTQLEITNDLQKQKYNDHHGSKNPNNKQLTTIFNLF